MTANKIQARPQQHFTVKLVSQVTVWACDGSILCAAASGKMEQSLLFVVVVLLVVTIGSGWGDGVSFAV